MTDRRMRIDECSFGKAHARAWYGQPWHGWPRWWPMWRRELTMSSEARRRRDERALLVAARVARVGGHG